MTLKSLFALFLGLVLCAGLAAQGLPNGVPPAPPPLDPENELVLDLSTGGRVVIQLRPDVAPRHVERIKTLARRGFYNGLTFHRVIDGFMAQTGDPKGDGSGGSDLPDLAAEFNGLPHMRGAVAAARMGAPPRADAAAIKRAEDSANSQFFIMFSPKLAMDGEYTVFGRVIAGMQYVDAVNRGEPPTQPSRIVQASILADNKPPPSPQAEAAVVVHTPGPLSPSIARPVQAAGPAMPPPPSIRQPDPPQQHKKPPPSGH
jgi:cyclophilin family peptidyl-prolyl cis-trans isomerase